jgi:hypothetical protein
MLKQTVYLVATSALKNYCVNSHTISAHKILLFLQDSHQRYKNITNKTNTYIDWSVVTNLFFNEGCSC